MDKTILLTINRKGTFAVEASQFDASQCGKMEKTDYGYEVAISASAEKLIEPEKFVLDNNLVHQYFIDKYEKEKCLCLSCEVMACEAVNYFKGLFIGEDAPHKEIDVRRISVVIRGSDHSFISGEWRKEDK